MPKFSGGVSIDSKGYLVIKSGPLRDIRVHTLVAEAMLGRKLNLDETVHHLDGDKLNCRFSNLQILNRRDHGAVSSKQRWWLREHEIEMKRDWEEIAGSFADEDVSFDVERL